MTFSGTEDSLVHLPNIITGNGTRQNQNLNNNIKDNNKTGIDFKQKSVSQT